MLGVFFFMWSYCSALGRSVFLALLRFACLDLLAIIVILLSSLLDTLSHVSNVVDKACLILVPVFCLISGSILSC